DAIYAYSESLHKVFITLIPLSSIGFLASLVLKRTEPASKGEEGEAAPKPAALE
ncbi:hypothetical protein EV182_003693, partial [Spiromyces aspiralis]